MPPRVAADGGADPQARIEGPARLADFGRCEPIWEDMPGWKQPTTEARTLDALPSAARAYLGRISALLDLPIALVSVGASREQVIVESEVFD